MKKSTIITLTIVLICAALAGWCILMDPVSIQTEDVGSIEVYKYHSFLDGFGKPTVSESEFVITDENHIHYITGFLNNLLPIPGEVGYSNSYRTLTIRGHQGNTIAEITLPNNDCYITEKGTFWADVGELNTNLYNIEKGEAIRTSMAAFGLILISWLFVAVLIGMAGLFMFLIQMGICYKTDSLSLRLLPTMLLALLWLMNFRTQIITSLFYWASDLGFDSGEFGVYLLIGVVGLCIFLGWRQGDSGRKQKNATEI